MNAQARARCVAMLIGVALAPAVDAMELGQPSAPATQASATFAFPMFLDGARLPDFQDAWRAHFAGRAETETVQVAPVSGEPAAAAAIDDARQALSRAEQVDREAVAVRERAEALSRRFAADADGGSAPAPDPTPAPVSPDDGPVTETASVSPSADDLPAPAVRATVAVTGNSAADAPVVQQAAATADDAPVIEAMATVPAKPVKRRTVPAPMHAGLQTAATQPAAATPPLPEALLRVDPAAPKPDPNPGMPTELRAFGWNSQP